MKLLHGLWRILVGVKDALVLVAMLIFFGLLYALLQARPTTSMPSSGALVLAFDGGLVEQPADAEPLDLLSRSGVPSASEYRLRDVLRAIRAAAGDATVKAVVLDLDRFTGGGQAALTEAGAALDAVRRAGKPVLAYATGYSDDGYQLAAHASEVWINPLGGVVVTGPGGQRLYYKGLLDKLGVQARVYKVGRFKSAVEPFIREDQSPEARAANQALADALWLEWQGDVARGRPQAQIAPYLAALASPAGRRAATLAEDAVAYRLADRIGSRAEFGRRVAALAGQAARGSATAYATLPLNRYIEANPWPASGSQIGVVTIAGEIVDGRAPPGTAGGETISRLVRDALATRDLKALVLRIDSPGGSVTASEEIRAAVAEARARKLPVVVSMGSVAASGGYWIATAGDAIFAEPSTITGSIGVFGILPTFRGAMEKLGLNADGVKTTPFSGEPDIYDGPDPATDRLIQAGVDQIYARFTGLVAASRRLSPARVDEIGQGRVWAGGIARQLGLVDRFGGLDDAIAEAARRARIAPGSVRPVFIEREPSYSRRLLADLIGQGVGEDVDHAAVDPLARLAARPDRIVAGALAEARGVLAGPTLQARCLQCGAAERTMPTRGAGWLGMLAGWLG